MTTEKLTNPLTDSELARLIWSLKAEGFHQRLLSGLVELQQRRMNDGPLVGIDLESAVDRLTEKRDRTQGGWNTMEQVANCEGFRAGAKAGLTARFDGSTL